MKCFPGARRAFVVAALIVVAISAGHAQTGRELELHSMGMFFVGGSRAEDANLGQAEWVGQSLVHYLKPKVSSRSVPLVLYPGLGLSSYIYMTTPDDRDGWAQLFVRGGFDVYVYDPVDTDPSTLPTIEFRLVEDGVEPVSELPGVRKWDIPFIWSRWGLGPSENVPNPNVRFPIAAVEQFYASWPARVGGGGGGGAGGSPQDSANLIELLEKIGPAVLVPHSAAGPVAFDVATSRPELVEALVVIEPTGCPDDPADLWPDAIDTPFFAVYGDYIAQRGQTGRLAACTATASNVTGAGGVGEVLELTQEGIFGNTHLMMQDDNNDYIAGEIMDWIEQHVDVPLSSGFVPDGGDIVGEPLRVALEGSGNLRLDWDEPVCGDAYVDYEVYEGSLGDFGSHQPVTCTTHGATTATVPSSAADSSYYLVVPRSQTREGSYGLMSDDAERPASVTPCLERQIAVCQ